MQKSNYKDSIWVYNSPFSRFPCAIFDDLEVAIIWILKNKISGTLTLYPINISVYELCINNGLFTPNKEKHYSREFIGNFTSASQEHSHFEFDEDGIMLGGYDDIVEYFGEEKAKLLIKQAEHTEF